jgi:hypothetical protein
MSRIPAVILQRRPAFFLINTQGLLFMRHFFVINVEPWFEKSAN